MRDFVFQMRALTAQLFFGVFADGVNQGLGVVDLIVHFVIFLQQTGEMRVRDFQIVDAVGIIGEFFVNCVRRSHGVPHVIIAFLHYDDMHPFGGFQGARPTIKMPL